jgi:polysaccharide deacetylase 2 family uncharacterized protein YibQ
MINKIFWFILSSLVLSSITLTQAHSAQLVIIIDDIGNNYQLGNAIVELKGPLTLAFLPHTPYAKKLANKAYLQQKEIILHAPMENTVKAALGPGALTQALTETELKQSLKKSIASIPHVQGMNNHMGSALTQNKKAMTWVMETLQTEQLYFVDSLTSPNSVAYQQAINHQLPALRRHIFLDNDKSLEALTRQWNKALRIAHNTGRAILIGHPYTESHDFLAKQLPKLAAKGIELIPASQLLLQQAWQEFDKGELQTQTMPNRYLLQDNNIRASDNNEQKLISHNLGTQPH